MFQFKCACGRALKARPEQVGKKAKCPGCGAAVTIPSPEAAAAAGPSETPPVSAVMEPELGPEAAAPPESEAQRAARIGALGAAAKATLQGKPAAKKKDPGAQTEALKNFLSDIGTGKPVQPEAVMASGSMEGAAVPDKQGRIRVRCRCGQKYKVKPEEQAGQIKCTRCNRAVNVPAKSEQLGLGSGSAAVAAAAKAAAESAQLAMASGSMEGAAVPDQQGRIRVKCRCGQKYKVHQEEAAGQVKCSRCGRMVNVPAKGEALGAKPARRPRGRQASASGTVPAVKRPGAPAAPPVPPASAGAKSPAVDSGPEMSGDMFSVNDLMKHIAAQGGAAPGAAASAPPPGAPAADRGAMSSSGLFNVEELKKAVAAGKAPGAAPSPDDDKSKMSSSGLFNVGELKAAVAAGRPPDAPKPAQPKAAAGDRFDLTAPSGDSKPKGAPAAPEKGRIDLFAPEPAVRKAPDAPGGEPAKPAPAKPADEPAKSGKAAAEAGPKSGKAAAEAGPKSGKAAAEAGAKSGKSAKISDVLRSGRSSAKAGAVGAEAPGSLPIWKTPAGMAAGGLALVIVLYVLFFSGGGAGAGSGGRAPPPDSVLSSEDDTAGYLRSLTATPGQPVQCVAFSPDGTKAAAGGADRLVHVWDLATGRELYKLEGNREAVLAVAFTRDGARIAAAGRDGLIRLWSAADGKPAANLTRHVGPVNALRFSDDGRLMASGGADRRIVLWDMSQMPPAPIADLAGHEAAVNALSFSGDSKLLLSGAGIAGQKDSTLRIWSIDERREIRANDALVTVYSAELLSDGKSAVAAGDGDSVHIINLETGADSPLAGHKAAVMSVALSPDGTRVLSSAARGDTSVMLWDPAAKSKVRSFEIPAGDGPADGVRCIAVSPAGKRFLAGCSDGTVKLWGIGR